jgi:TRAP-type mannitol/chloroaromatic compound transport system permease large subunit
MKTEKYRILKEISFHIMNNKIIFDEPFFIHMGESLKFESMTDDLGELHVEKILLISKSKPKLETLDKKNQGV